MDDKKKKKLDKVLLKFIKENIDKIVSANELVDIVNKRNNSHYTLHEVIDRISYTISRYNIIHFKRTKQRNHALMYIFKYAMKNAK